MQTDATAPTEATTPAPKPGDIVNVLAKVLNVHEHTTTVQIVSEDSTFARDRDDKITGLRFAGSTETVPHGMVTPWREPAA